MKTFVQPQNGVGRMLDLDLFRHPLVGLATCYNPSIVPGISVAAGMSIQTLTIVGVGLIGGSIGLAAKQRDLAKRVLGAGRRQASLQQALARGAIDESFLDFREAVHQADFAVFCTPV